MRMSKRLVTAAIVAMCAGAVLSGDVGQKRAPEGPQVEFMAGEMASSFPRFERMGAVTPNGESSPFVFRGKLYRLELADPTRGTDFSDPRIHCEIREAKGGRLVSSFAHAKCYYPAAFVDGDTVRVTATKLERTADGKVVTGGRIMVYESKDLVEWKERVLFERPGFRFFNTTVAKGPDGYVLAMETNTRPQCGVPFTMFFATSKDFVEWKAMDDSTAFPKRWYCGGPFMVWCGGWYYLSLVTALPCERFCQYLYRTRDFRKWETGRYNPLLLVSDDDRRVSPNAHSLDSAMRGKIARAFVCSASDLEMCDYEGKTYMVYGIGDQKGFYYFAEAWYNGPMSELLENFFR